MRHGFRFVFRPPGFHHQNVPPHVITQAPRALADALDWSPAKLTTIARVTSEDIKDTRAWLRRLGLEDALEAFDA